MNIMKETKPQMQGAELNLEVGNGFGTHKI